MASDESRVKSFDIDQDQGLVKGYSYRNGNGRVLGTANGHSISVAIMVVVWCVESASLGVYILDSSVASAALRSTSYCLSLLIRRASLRVLLREASY